MNRKINKEIIYGDAISDHIKKAIETIYVPVSSTLGSHGRYVALQNPNGSHRFTKDGVSVASEISSQVPVEEVFIRAVADTALSTLGTIGDGTTSTVVVTYHMINNMLLQLSQGVKDRKSFFSGVDDAMLFIERAHASMKPKSDMGLEELIKVATTSSNGDHKFGKILGEIYHKIGSEGIVNLKYHDENEIGTEFVGGYIIEEGILAKDFINGAGASHLENPYILVTNREITNADSFLKNILSPVFRLGNGRPLFVVAGGYSVEVLQTLIKNKDKITCVPIKAPSMGDARNSYLEDLSEITGSTFIDGEKDMHLEDHYGDETSIFNILGSCKSVESRMDETIVTIDEPVKEEYVAKLEELVAGSDNDYAKSFTSNRIAKLRGTIATLILKRATTTEMSLDYDRYDDAIKATRNAMKNGVLSGGGSSYIRIHEICSNEFNEIYEGDDRDYILGFTAIVDSLLSILKVNLENSNHSEAEFEDIKFKIQNSTDEFFMYDTVTQNLGNAFDFGVLESYQSSIVCIRNAFGVSKVIVNTGSAVVNAVDLF